MTLTALDWPIIAAYFALSLAHRPLLLPARRREHRRVLRRRTHLPWWLAGTSMVATTFAADTPLAVTEMVARNGVAGNWLWWSMLPSGMLTVFFFARLWRRAEVMTDVEFVELRYSGRPAAFLRGFRALYLGLAHQPDHHGLGEPRDGQGPERHARPAEVGGAGASASASPSSTRSSPASGASSSPTPCSS